MQVRTGFAATLRKCKAAKKILLRKQEDWCYKAFKNNHVLFFQDNGRLGFSGLDGSLQDGGFTGGFSQDADRFFKKKKLIDTGFWWFFA